MNIIDKLDENISKKNELQPIKENNVSIIDRKEKHSKDYQKTLKILDELADIGFSSVKDLANLAATSDKPIAYEHLGNLLEKVADTRLKMHELHKNHIELEYLEKNGVVGKTTSLSGEIQVENAVFIGNSVDLLTQINNANIPKISSEIDTIDLPPKPVFKEEHIIESEEDMEEEMTVERIQNETEDLKNV